MPALAKLPLYTARVITVIEVRAGYKNSFDMKLVDLTMHMTMLVGVIARLLTLVVLSIERLIAVTY